MKKIIETKDLIIHFIKHSECNFVSTQDFINFMKYLNECFLKKNLFKKYLVSFDITMHSVIRTVMYNSDILEHSIGYDMIYVKEKQLNELVLKYPIDPIIEDMIKKYYELKDLEINNSNDKRISLKQK